MIIEKLNISQIQQLFELIQKLQWPRSMDELKIMIKKSMSFALIEPISEKLIGYTRVLTDEVKYAFIFNVIVDEDYQKLGLGRVQMEAVISHPKLKKIQNFELTCSPAMKGFYEKFGFSREYMSAEFGEVIPLRFQRLVNE